MTGGPQLRVGISGWDYPPWRGAFYPTGLPHRRELEYAAERLTSIEINGTFYSLKRPEHFRAWRERVPDDFVFAIKGGRYITHLRKLSGVDAALANFFASGVLALGPKLGPVLWQLPPTLGFDAERMRAFLTLLPRSTAEAARLAERHDDKVPDDRALTTCEADLPLRHAVEVRHRSFEAPEWPAIAREHGVAIVIADTAGMWPMLDVVTADFVYARLHGAEELYASGYTDAALDHWAERVRGWRADGLDCHVYFDNDVKARAPFDAMALLDRVRATG